MSTNNPAPGVGGTAKDGGLSTAATVADGGPDSKQEDPSFAGDDGKTYEGCVGPQSVRVVFGDRATDFLSTAKLGSATQPPMSAEQRKMEG